MVPNPLSCDNTVVNRDYTDNRNVSTISSANASNKLRTTKHIDTKRDMEESAATANGSRPLSWDAKRFKSTPVERALPSSSLSLRYTSTVKLSPIKDDYLLRNIFSFVGEYQYRFVGGVNRTFHKSYLTLYPNKKSHFNSSTVELTKYCWKI